jgi:uroporphyrinogen decarboxylase
LHREPDKVPIDLNSTRDSSIVADGYERLKAAFGVTEQNRITSMMMQTVDVNEKILDALDIDTRAVSLSAPTGGGDRKISDNRYVDEWGVERVKKEGAFYYDQEKFPLSGEITVHDIVKYPWPDPTDKGRLRSVKERIHRLRAEDDYALVLNLPSGFVHISQYLRGFEDWFLDFAMNQKLMEALFDAVLDVNIGICDTVLQEVGCEVDILMASDDLGLQNSLIVSLDDYRKYIRPRHEKYFRKLHVLSPAKVFFHTCGSIVTIMDDLADIGVDVVHPVQVTAKGMDPADLKKRFGRRMCFWGAIDTQHVLPYGTPEQVEAEVERMIEILGVGGGYVLGAVHNIQPDVPTENVIAMFRRARTYMPSWRRSQD